MTPSNSRLSISASGAIFSSLVLVSVLQSCVKPRRCLPTLNLRTPKVLVDPYPLTAN